MTGPHTINLPWQDPPLSLNDRKHWRAKVEPTRDIRTLTAGLAHLKELPKNVGHAVVELHYRPPNRIRRDTDNLVATAKPIYDGLVDYGLVPDDVPQRMSKPEPVIHQPAKDARVRLWLEITTSDTPKELAA